MMYPEPDHEQPYIDAERKADAHDAAKAKAVEWLWQELRDEAVADTMADDVEAFLKFGKLVSLVADLKKCCAIADESSDQDVTAYNKAGLVQGFLNQAATLIETAYEYHVDKEAEREAL